MGTATESQPDLVQSLQAQSTQIQSTNAALVNISGRQRMLSQRITMFCLMLVHEPQATKRDTLRGNIQQLTALMEQSHQGLIDGSQELKLPGKPSDIVRAIYFEPPFNVDRQIRNFTTAVRAFLQKNDDELHASNSELTRITATASTRLLPALDAVVAQYQKESETERQALENERLAALRKESRLLQQAQQRSLDLKIAKEKAEAASVAKSTFLANMSHELRTPLNAILGFSQLMGRDTSLSPAQQNTIATINRSGNHLLELINDVLDISKIEAGQTTLKTTDFDLNCLLKTLYQMFSLKAGEQGIQLRIHEPSEQFRYVSGDESKLRQILINIIGNAVKFTHHGHVTLNVCVSELQSCSNNLGHKDSPHPRKSAKKHSFRFIIEDTGDGIDSDELSNIFEMFTQTNTGIKSQEGTGLGLAISRQFAQLMEGDITITSVPNQGTRVEVEVQLAEASYSRKQTHDATRVVGLLSNSPRYRILIADDCQENRLLLAQYMEAVGFEVEVCNDGQEAIKQWKRWQPHFIWMDWRMPVMNGYNATQAIRALERQRPQKQHDSISELPSITQFSPLEKTVIVALSASVFDETASKLQEAGCDDFLRKPFHESQLFDILQKHLELDYVYAESAPSQPEQNSQERLDFTHSMLTQLKKAMEHMPPHLLSDLQSSAIHAEEELLQNLIASMQAQYPQAASALQTLCLQLRLDIIAEVASHALASNQRPLEAF